MGCRIEHVKLDNGQNSHLFLELSKKMPPAKALETYISLKNKETEFKKLYGENSQGEVNGDKFSASPRFKEVEFDTYAQQTDVMDMLTTYLMEEMKIHPALESETNITGINFSKITAPILQGLIQKVRQSIVDDMFADNSDADANALLRVASLNLPTYLSPRGPLTTRLKDYGVHLNVKDTFTEVESMHETDFEQNGRDNEESKQVEYERIYDMDVLESPASSSMLEQVKVYLRSKNRVRDGYKFKDNAPIEYAVAETGFPAKAQFEVLIGKMYGVLKGVQSPAEMMSRLENALDSSPELAPVFRDLVVEKPTTVGGRAYKPLAAALFSAFAKHDYNMFSVAELVGGDVIYTKANSSSVRNRIKAGWGVNISDVQKLPKSELQKRQGYIEGFMDTSSYTHGLKKSNPTAMVLNLVARQFQHAGIDVNAADIRQLLADVKENPRKLDKNLRSSPSNRSIVSTFLKSLVIPVIKNKDVYSTESSNLGERKLLNLLADARGKSMHDVHVGSFRSGRGTMIHPINNSAEAHDVWNRIYTSPEEFAKFAEDPIYGNSLLLSLLDESSEHRAEFDVMAMDVLSDNSRPGTGKTYGQLSSFDAIITKMNGFYGHNENNYFYAFSPTQSDRGNAQAIIVPKLNVTEAGAAKPLFDTDGEPAADIRDWVKNHLVGELSRIAKIKANGSIYKNYEKNGSQFTMFENLNNEDLGDLNSQEVIEAKAEALATKAMMQMQDIIKSDVDFMIKKGVITKDGAGFKTTKGADKQVISKAKRGRKISKVELEGFLVNNMIYNYEQTLFYVGDPAYFKGKADLNKRFGLPFTPGVKPTVGENTGIAPTAEVKIIQEAEMKAELAEVYNKITGASMFKRIELADGAGFVSLDRYKQLMLSRGMHNDQMIELIDKLNNWKEGDKMPKSEVYLETLKGFYFRLQQGVEGSIVPFNLKYSIMPVIPTLFERKVNGEDAFPGMAAISRELRTGKADEVVLESAVKVGGNNAATIENLADTPSTTIHNDSYRFPQPSPSKEKTEDNFGSQMRNLIMSNYVPNQNIIVGREGKVAPEFNSNDAMKLYNEAISLLAKTGGDSVYNQLVTNDTPNTPVLIEKLLADVERNSFNNTEYFQEALLDLGFPLNYPTVQTKMDSLVNASFKRAVNRMKLPGHSAVQVSSLGMARKEGIITDSDLKFVTFMDADGNRVSNELALQLAKDMKTPEKAAQIQEAFTIAPAEVRVTPKFFKGTLRQIATKRAKSENSVAKITSSLSNYKELIEMADPYNKISEFDKQTALEAKRIELEAVEVEKHLTRLTNIVTKDDGSYDIDVIREAGLDEVVMYRIPTQGKNSMLPAKIKDFMPPEFGGTIQVPAEIVDQAGSDFDIDKVYLEMRDFDVQGNELKKVQFMNEEGVDISTTRKAKAYIVEYHRAVLSSPQYLADLLQPNGSVVLKEIIAENNLGEGSSTASWNSLELQETFRNNNKSGKELISLSSIASVAHSNASHIGAYFTKDVKIGGKVIKLGEMYNLEGQKLIAEGKVPPSSMLILNEIAEVQNAALDNAKEPLLGQLNIDQFTASALFLMVSTGQGLEFSTAILNAPVVRELAEAYTKFSRKYNDRQSFKLAKKQVQRAHKIGRVKLKGAYKLDSYTLADAKHVMKSDDNVSKAIALKAFEDIRGLGDKLSSFQNYMRADSAGTPSTVSKLIDKYTGMALIKGTEFNNSEIHSSDGILNLKNKLTFKEKQRLGAIGVDPVKWQNSHLSTMAENSLKKALQAQRHISPSASDQYARIITAAKENLPYLNENQQTQLLVNYSYYLLANSRSNEISTSGLATSLANGEFLKLSDPTSGESTASLLQAYRRTIKDQGVPENKFTENLIVKKDKAMGREFVTFNNTIARSLTGEAKKEMMFFFEDLMSSENQTDRQLAKSLSDYAISHYGYTKSINSFMEFIAPSAHKEFMKGEGISPVEFFKELDGTYNNPDTFNNTPEEFIDLYVQNQAESLPITAVSSSDLEWKSRLISEAAIDRTNPPMYVKETSKTGTRLYKYDENGYSEVQRRGIPNLMLEYHNGTGSFVNDSVSTVSMDSASTKNKATETNKAVIKSIEDKAGFSSFNEMLSSEGFFSTDFKNLKGATRFLEEMYSRMSHTDEMSVEKFEYLKHILTRFAKSADVTRKLFEKKGKSVSYDTLLKDLVNADLNMMIDHRYNPRHINMIEKIKTCN